MWHDTIASFVAALCLWAIVSPRAPTGVLGTAGLGALAVAALWSLDDFADPYAALDLALSGAAIVGVAMAWRLLRRRRPSASTEPSMVDPQQWSSISGGRKQ